MKELLMYIPPIAETVDISTSAVFATSTVPVPDFGGENW